MVAGAVWSIGLRSPQAAPVSALIQIVSQQRWYQDEENRHVCFLSVRRKRDTIRLVKVRCDDANCPSSRVKSVYVVRQSRRRAEVE